ncbi:MAG: hypothetical protein GEV07_16265 [Streptosporangiales bacterium]|nr:hypothetical protein [Streptosporangiales bacterium]
MSFRERVRGGEQLVGAMMSDVTNPNLAVMLATAGLDFFIIDMEHGTCDWSDMAALVSTARGWGITPMVRIPEIRRETVLKPLDAGATGLVVPQVEEVAQVEEVLAHARYPDTGRRGVALRRAHSAYAARNATEYMQQANEETLVLVQIETRRGLDNLEQLAKIDGLGGFLIGPFDLSVDMGLPAEVNHPDVRAAFRKVIDVAEQHGIVSAIHVQEPDTAIELFAEGMQVCSVSSDINMIVDQAAENTRKIRESLQQ